MAERNIPLFKVFMSEDAVKNATDVLRSGYIGQGKKVEEFEEKLKKQFQSEYVLTTNSGTSAEHLALHLLKKPQSPHWGGMKQGDTVLTTPLSCTATSWPILANGFNIEWVDVDKETLNMDLDALQRQVRPETKAIIVLHWGGNPIDLEWLAAIRDYCFELHGFRPMIIEDCAHAFGATFNEKPIGSSGNICFFSWQAIKHLSCGDGGALVVPDETLYKRGKLVRWYGIDRETNLKNLRCELDIEEWGFKFHMNDISASIGLGNFGHMDSVLAAQRSNHDYYLRELQGIDGVEFVKEHPKAVSSVWLFTILVDRKQDFIKKMAEHGIMTSSVHRRNDEHPCVSQYHAPLPNLDEVAPKVVSIPVGWWVTEEDRYYIVKCIKAGW